MFHLLVDPLVEIHDAAGRRAPVSLPELYKRLADDSVIDFPSLRPHQRHAWHALLCQLGALACIKAGLAAPPADASGWSAALRTLTPGFPGDEPWHLVANPDQPAFLQPPVGLDLGGFKSLATPDQLDMLVTAKNHDLKAARLTNASIDDWLFALVTLQTMEGFLGAGNYGVSRMNGGFGNRPGFSIAPPGRIGAHIMRDLTRLVEMRDEVLDHFAEFDEDGLALVWMRPWDGIASLSPKQLDPYYVEICRRVRLVARDGHLSALIASSKATRVAFGKEARGITGDPWTPTEIDDTGAKALTIDARGFSYKRLADILFEDGFQLAPLQQFRPGDRLEASHVLICRALARGQGKTEGFHERRIHVSPKALHFWRSGQLEPLSELSQARIEQAAKVARALRYALMVLFQNGPDRSEFKAGDPSSSRRADLFVKQFEAVVDRSFFELLFAEFEIDGDEAKRRERARWLASLRDQATDLLKAAESGAPSSSIRHYRAWVRAERALRGVFYKAFGDTYFPKDDDHVAA
jgi:CRISPR system Cascade subunit CasA